jgi:hypothetical protein
MSTEREIKRNGGGLKRGVVYGYQVDDPSAGRAVGYVGQSRNIEARDRQHRTAQPWADLIVGRVWILRDAYLTDRELDRAETRLIRKLKPLYNVLGQETARWAVPRSVQKAQRAERDLARAAAEALIVPEPEPIFAPESEPISGPELVTLSAALRRLPGRPLSIEAIRTATRRPGFPAPVRPGSAGVAGLYDLDSLIEWKNTRDGLFALYTQ